MIQNTAGLGKPRKLRFDDSQAKIFDMRTTSVSSLDTITDMYASDFLRTTAWSARLGVFSNFEYSALMSFGLGDGTVSAHEIIYLDNISLSANTTSVYDCAEMIQNMFTFLYTPKESPLREAWALDISTKHFHPLPHTYTGIADLLESKEDFERQCLPLRLKMGASIVAIIDDDAGTYTMLDGPSMYRLSSSCAAIAVSESEVLTLNSVANYDAAESSRYSPRWVFELHPLRL